MSRPLPIKIMLASALYQATISAASTLELTSTQKRYWIEIQSNWQYIEKQPVLLSAETSITETLCPPSWEPDHGAVYHDRLTFSFLENSVRHYCEVCISGRSKSYRPIAKPDGGTQ